VPLPRRTSHWVEVADGVLARRYEPWDVTVTVVRGADGLLVVDTRASARQGAELVEDLAALGAPVRWVVSTHAHFDHTFGSSRLGPGSALDAPVHAHERVPAHLDAYERPMLAAWLAQGGERAAELEGTVVTTPDVLVGDHLRLDVGGRAVDLRHLGRGHTDNDLVLHVPDAACWLLGDLVEESGPPMYGTGSFPLEWPATLQALLAAVEDGAVLVPGHGEPVDAAFVTAQRADLAGVADLVRELHSAGVPADQVVAAGGTRWPLPSEHLGTAVAEGYRALAADAVAP
jgi:glyoxylase-like metal-dependent hydrolase (beta-lactamase superfamily II)